MAEPPNITRLFHRLPGPIQETIRDGLKRSELLLLLKFYFGTDNVLREKGWFDSERNGVPLDGDGNPIPWYTYPMIDLLDARLGDSHRVFEFGGGYSTLWYTERAGDVVAVDDSEQWIETVTRRLPENGQIIYRPSKDDYTTEVLEHGTFDVIVIDGSHRTECVETSLRALSDGGVLIWDDFDRLAETDYAPLTDNGFSFLPFWGLKPLVANYKCTTVFYRADNCLEI